MNHPNKIENYKLQTQVTQTTHTSTRRFLTASILLLGMLLVIGSILDLGAFTLFSEWELSIHKFISVIFYSCIGLLCITLGLERALDLSQIDRTLKKQLQTLDSIDNHISQFRQYKLIENYHDIYDLSLELIEKASTNIRSVVYANSPKAPDSWNQAVADCLRTKADAGFPVQFDIVICMNPEDMNESFISATEKRFSIYKERGADNYFHRYIQYMEKTIGQDCLIVDDKYLIISFPTILSNKTQKALFFENQEETVRQYINWFNSYAMFEALSINSIIKKIKLKTNN